MNTAVALSARMQRNATLGVVLILTGLLAGCRLGNRVEYPQVDDGMSGYYSNQATTVESYAFLDAGGGNTQERSQILTPNQTPTNFTAVMTNPVTLILNNQNRSLGFLVSPAALGSTGAVAAFDVDVDTTSKDLTFNGATAAVPFLDDANCNYQFGRIIVANVDTTGANQTVGGYKVRGSFSGQIMQVEFLTEVTAGSCQAIRTKAHDCYLSLNACGATNAEQTAFQTRVKAYFDPYIQNGTITVPDIATILEFGVIVTYE